MKLRHHPGVGPAQTLATTVEDANTFFDRALGLICATSLPESYVLFFPVIHAGSRTSHTIGVRTATDILWVVGSNVTAVETLPPLPPCSLRSLREDGALACRN